MTDPFARLRHLLRELKRRNVYKVATTYAVVGFVLIQVANLTFVRLGLPSWTVTFVIVLVALGFPLALILAWAFEMTPEGVRRTPEAGPADEGAAEADEGLSAGYKVLVGLGLVAAAVAGGWYLTGGGGGETTPRLGDRSIAVLPFEALGREQPGAFTEGMHDDLLARLSNVSGLKVISRTAVQQYRGSEKTTGQVARELGVRWVLEGAVQEMGDRIQVNAQLIDPRTETHAWAETYRRDLTAEDLFDLQGEITRRIARSLEAELTPEEADRVERKPTADLEAYRLYVEGRTLLDRRTESGMRQAVGYFRRAVERDSSYALAWTGLADARILLASYGHGPADSLMRRAREAARQALEIQPSLAEAHASLGLIHQHLRDGPAAVRKYRRAIELKPSYARSHHWFGLLQLALGRLDGGLSSLERAAQLDPNSPSIQVALAWAQHLDGRSGEALESARRARELSPGYPVGRIAEGVALIGTGEFGAALEALRRGLEAGRPESQTHRTFRGLPALAYLRAGDTAGAHAYLAELERRGASRFAQGLARAALGRADAAFADLRQARWYSSNSPLLRYGAAFEPLRHDPRYDELVRDLNRTWGLNPDGSWPDESGPTP